MEVMMLSCKPVVMTAFLCLVGVVILSGPVLSEETSPTVVTPEARPARPTEPSRPAEPLAAPFTANDAQAAQAAWAASLGRDVVVRNPIGMELVLIPPGTFRMGSPRNERSRDDDEDQIDATLSKAFYLGKTEVTQQQWRSVMGTTPWKDKEYIREGDDFPATHVNWDDAQAFCRKLGAQSGVTYRLPTEAEWEYACRAGTTARFGFNDKPAPGRGDGDPDERALREYGWWGALEGEGNCLRERYPHEVATRKPNPFGLYDLHGNVWEWCEDAYDQSLPGGRDPLRSDAKAIHVFRGGSWVRFASNSRPAMREWYAPSLRNFELGFRVACNAAPGR